MKTSPPLVVTAAAALLAVALAAGTAAASAPAADPASPATGTSEAPPPSSRPALVIDEGSTAGRRVVALGRELVNAGRVDGDAAAISADARVSGTVEGDLVVFGGNAQLSAGARVRGDLMVLGGRIDAARGAVVEGRSVAYPNASGAWLALMEAPALGMDASANLLLGVKLALLTAWMALVILLSATAGRQVLDTSAGVREEPFRCFTVGFVGVLAMLLTALATSLLAASFVGLPFLVLVILFALAAKMWGMVAVFHALGSWVGERLLRRRLMPLNAASLGLLLLGAVKLVPWVGLWVWHVATFIAVGAALVTKFGRRERWFDFAALERAPG